MERKNFTYFPYYCESILDESRNDYHVCFENETKSIGPFYYWQNEKYKKPYRIVTFTSADGKIKFASFTIDFLETMAGNYMLKPNMDWTNLSLKRDIQVYYRQGILQITNISRVGTH